MTNTWTFLSNPVFGDNQVWHLLALFGCILAALVIGRILKFVLSRASTQFKERGNATRAAVCGALARSSIFVLFTLGLRYGIAVLRLPENIAALAQSTTSVLFAIAIGWVLYCLVDVVDAALRKAAQKTRSKMDDMLVPMVRKSLRITIVVLVLIQVAQILSDKPITSIIAGLGVGGLAVALAAQETIKNFFGSLVIFADKPFELGDRIVVDGHDGPVEEVGFRSTKIRTLDGHVVTVPNGELANRSIQNIGRRPYIRRVGDITVTYDTAPDKVQRAIEIIKELLDNHEGMHADLPPRVFFNKFNDASLNILFIYWYHPPDYWAFMAFSERFNMDLLKRYNEEGIDFAFPTQTLYLAGDPARPLSPPDAGPA